MEKDLRITHLECKSITSVAGDYDVFLLDIWGVIVEGTHLYPGVVDCINALIVQRKKIFFLTNAPVHRKILLPMMQSWKIHVDETMIVTSGEIAAHMILNSAATLDIRNPVIYHLEGNIDYLMDASLVTLTTQIQEANLLLLTLYCDYREDLQLDQWDEVLKIASKKNILTLCANPDIGIMQQGIYRYCAGYFAEKIKEWGGKVIYTGKPYSSIYQRILNQLPDIPKSRILMVGDTFHTDIAGANQMGIASALVLTGNAAPFHNPYKKLEDKLIQLTHAARIQKAMPDFVIQLGEVFV